MLLPQYIALRYTKSGSSKSFVAFINRFSIAGIALGIAALIIVLSVMNGLEGQLKSRILGILPHIVVNSSDVNISPEFQDNLIATAPYIENEVVVQSRNELKGVIMQGVDGQTDAPFSIIAQKMVAGRYASLTANSYNVIISSALSNQLGVSIGDKLRLVSPQASVYSPLGRIPSQRLFQVSGIFNVVSEMDDKVVIVDYRDAARLIRQKPQDAVHTRLYLKDAFDYQTITEYLQQEYSQVQTWRARQGALFDAVKMEKNMMTLMLGLVILVAGFNVVSALVMVVAEKTKDIAILQTQGMLPNQIMQIFLLNGVFNGAIGALLGSALGILGVFGLNPLLDAFNSGLAFGENGQGLPIDVRLIQCVSIVLLTMILCALASIYPARKAAQIRPANGLAAE
ncbi:lipoprotein-releasing ABC transporter permease subunit [Glaciecola sp. 1036]|uniref:lipoprotein-releasing ABC transporter permease subunit n=1 Tax=Alteromonadaceae TaxID=72275 RepID=UPI003D023370